MVTALLAIAMQSDNTLPLMAAHAGAARSLAVSEVTREFLRQVVHLPDAPKRKLYINLKGDISTSPQSGFEPKPLTNSTFYFTKYGTPIAYFRVIEAAGLAGMKTLSGKKVLDIGYGTIGHLRMMASAGASVVGVDVDTFLQVLYPVSEQGKFRAGKVRLIHGSWPGDKQIKTYVGDGYDLITSKNTLKRGYIHPEGKAKREQLIDLGVTDAVYLKSVYDALKPGGLFIVYNLSPAQSEDPEKWIPWADGRCAFTKSQLATAGFDIERYDYSEDEIVAQMAVIFGWARSEGEAIQNLFSHLTVCKKPLK